MEDVGRHNAVDKIAGYMYRHGLGPDDKIFYTTGRLTSEMVIKTVQMGIPILVSRSGFTAWGVELARQADLTLIGRAQGQALPGALGCRADRVRRRPAPPARGGAPPRPQGRGADEEARRRERGHGRRRGAAGGRPRRGGWAAATSACGRSAGGRCWSAWSSGCGRRWTSWCSTQRRPGAVRGLRAAGRGRQRHRLRRAARGRAGWARLGGGAGRASPGWRAWRRDTPFFPDDLVARLLERGRAGGCGGRLRRLARAGASGVRPVGRAAGAGAAARADRWRACARSTFGPRAARR